MNFAVLGKSVVFAHASHAQPSGMNEIRVKKPAEQQLDHIQSRVWGDGDE